MKTWSHGSAKTNGCTKINAIKKGKKKESLTTPKHVIEQRCAFYVNVVDTPGFLFGTCRLIKDCKMLFSTNFKRCLFSWKFPHILWQNWCVCTRCCMYLKRVRWLFSFCFCQSHSNSVSGAAKRKKNKKEDEKIETFAYRQEALEMRCENSNRKKIAEEW